MAKEYAKLGVNFIIVEREKRQRKTVGLVQDLADSIKRIGLINPITITRENVLIAGERRLEACKLLSEDYKIPVRYVDELDEVELQLIELEENLKRSELSWQDQVSAVRTMHDAMSSVNVDWSIAKTADHIGFEYSYVSRLLAMSNQMDNPKIKSADNISTALNIVERETQRAVDNEMNNFMQVLEPESKDKSRAKIYNVDFCQWVEDYVGPKFNLIHCDFPYGIDHQKSEQGNISTGAFTGYADTESTYWKLCSALAKNLDKIALPSSHIMFWFSMKFYTETVDFFLRNTNLELVDERPLIWFKSDNKGIVSDVTRRPRNVYETALLFSRGDRKIISPVANTYACPTVKTFHASEKPEPMLKHFFRMFVDEHSEVLDPTCGSGSAIRAAFDMGAKRAVGYEINEEFATSADAALTRMKGLKQLEKENKDD